MRDGAHRERGAAVIAKLALRSLFAHPVRSAVLAGGFGLGVAVMAILLGVAEVVLEQARSPGSRRRRRPGHQRAGGGCLPLASCCRAPCRRVRWPAACARHRRGARPRCTSCGTAARRRWRPGVGFRAASARSSIPRYPSVAAWVDAPSDADWTAPDPADLLRSMDGFHRCARRARARAASWAEWLYFNGRSPEARFYLTFLAGPRAARWPARGRRAAAARSRRPDGDVQRVRRGRRSRDRSRARPTSRSAATASGCEGLRYQLTLDLPRRRRPPRRRRSVHRGRGRQARCRRSRSTAPAAGSPATWCR